MTTFVLRRKHCINKIVKNPLRREKKIETACKKNSHTGKTKTKSLVTSSLQNLLLFKNVFVSLFSTSCDLLKTQVFRNNAIPLSVIYYEKLFLTFCLKKIVFYLCDCNNTIKRLIIKFDQIKLSSLKALLKKKKLLYLCTFGWNLKKAITIFLISTLEFFNM